MRYFCLLLTIAVVSLYEFYDAIFLFVVNNSRTLYHCMSSRMRYF